LLDWHFAGTSVPGIDLGWYLSDIDILVSATREMTIEWYRDRLARRLGRRFDRRWWQPQWELSQLGTMVRCGWGMAWPAVHDENPAFREWARNDLAWWAEHAQAATKWL
jgi:hypothetical protein